MKKTILTSLGVSILVVVSFVLAILYLPIFNFDTIMEKGFFGASVTEIVGTDQLVDFPTTYNANLNSLNDNKMEMATTSLDNVTTLSNLVTVGTIGTGVWQGTDIGVSYGGTGTSSPTQYLVMLGNGSLGLTHASTTGANGESLVSNGAGAYPSWQSVSFDSTANYTLTGLWDFMATTTMATTTINELTVASSTFTGITQTEFSTASSSIASVGYVDSKSDMVVWASPADAFHNNATVEANNRMTTSVYTNNADENSIFSVKVPASATSISSIEILYERDNTGNLQIRFYTGHFPKTIGSTITTDTTDTISAYAGGASDSTTGVITAPAASYDGHAALTEDDSFGIHFERIGTNGGDTYEADLIVYGVQVTFN